MLRSLCCLLLLACAGACSRFQGEPVSAVTSPALIALDQNELEATRLRPRQGLMTALAHEWPASVEALPPGNAKRGVGLYMAKYACASCHADPRTGLEGSVGPVLTPSAIQAGAARQPGKSERQFLYEAILDPNATIAPVCAGGNPCATPSAMPGYADSMSREEMADLIEFLMHTEGKGR